MVIGGQESYQRYPDLQAIVDELVRYDKMTESGLQAESVEDVQDACKEFALNKSTFLSMVWTLLIHDHRDLSLESITGEIKQTKRVWKKDGLCLDWQADFLRLATRMTTAPSIVDAELPEDLPRLKMPQPALMSNRRISKQSSAGVITTGGHFNSGKTSCRHEDIDYLPAHQGMSKEEVDGS